MTSLARLISFLLHPLFVPSQLVLIIALHAPSALGSVVPYYWTVGIIFVFTSILPALNLLLLRLMGTIQNIQMPEREDRHIPFMTVTLIFGGLTYLMHQRFQLLGITGILYLINLISLSAFLINFMFKISVHAMSICAASTVLIGLSLNDGSGQLLIPVIISLIASGMVMSSRLLLQAHTLTEVISGAGVGIAVACAAIVFFI